MVIVRNILIIIIVLLVQSTVFGRIDVVGVRPDLAMLILIFIAAGAEPAESILYGFFIGFVQDIYTPEYLGFNALTMSLIGFSLGIVKETLTVENYLVKTLVTFVACIFHDLLYLSLYTVFDFSLLLKLLLKNSLPGALYTSILAFLSIVVYKWVTGGGLKGVVRELTTGRR
ncbi:MAG: rod shape-determining protein MreD [Candidatus Latescibacterota bacterium]